MAFVAEFWRKSELINAIFFADYGNRMLPSSAGAPGGAADGAALDASKAPGVELLPDPDAWLQFQCYRVQNAFPKSWNRLSRCDRSAKSIAEALRHVSETMRVTPEEAAFWL